MPNIKSITFQRLDIPLQQPFVISLERFTHARNIVVRIEAVNGLVGWGECSPFPTINGETVETGLLIGEWLASDLIGVNFLDFRRCKDLMDSKVFGNSSIKSAIDIALYDLAAQYRHVPLYELWGASYPTELVTDYTVSLDSPEKMALAAQDIKAANFKAIKIKLGGTEEEDLDRLKAIREVVGDEIPLRLDANQGWKYATAKRILKALDGWNIDFCEAPISRRQTYMLPHLRKDVPVPIMADESCFDHHDAIDLLRRGSCDYLNIKLGKAGGLSEAKYILEVAEKLNTKVQIGGFLESRLAFTAAAHLALSSPAVKFIDMDTPLMFAEDPISGGLEYGDGGVITLPKSIGLGASVDEAFFR